MEHSRSRPGTEVIRAWAEQIDFSEKTIIVEGAVQSKDKVGSIIGDGKKFEVGWDKVVVAVGAFSQTFGVEGVKDHAFFLKDVADARAIRRRILECERSQITRGVASGGDCLLKLLDRFRRSSFTNRKRGTKEATSTFRCCRGRT